MQNQVSEVVLRARLSDFLSKIEQNFGCEVDENLIFITDMRNRLIFNSCRPVLVELNNLIFPISMDRLGNVKFLCPRDKHRLTYLIPSRNDPTNMVQITPDGGFYEKVEAPAYNITKISSQDLCNNFAKFIKYSLEEEHRFGTDALNSAAIQNLRNNRNHHNARGHN